MDTSNCLGGVAGGSRHCNDRGAPTDEYHRHVIRLGGRLRYGLQPPPSEAEEGGATKLLGIFCRTEYSYDRTPSLVVFRVEAH
mmetsp:Transcript_33162/g.92932  ORF Transcript_33162/g.92932 Transcript_33162/m.92932 type:complete len:83 (-) Transcript_33162:525-773(-)